MQQQPAVHTRPTGGFNQGFGDFSDEHLLEREQEARGEHDAAVAEDAKPELPKPPGPVQHGTSDPISELKQIGPDILAGLKEFTNFKKLLGLEDAPLTPEQEARAKTIHANFQRLEEEEQRVYTRRLQEWQQRQRQEEELEAQRKQANEDARHSYMPSTSKAPSGAQDPHAQSSTNQIRGPQSAN